MAKERKAKKLRRQAKLKKYYSTQPMFTTANQRRRMRNHIRSNPNDKAAVKTYEFVKNFGYATFEPNARGRKLAYIAEHGLAAYREHMKWRRYEAHHVHREHE